MEAMVEELEVTSWVQDVEEKLLEDHDPTTEVEHWRKHSIYRVPARIKKLNGGVYKPQTVSLGPFHHGDPDLLPMEKHKRRALLRLLRRAGRPPRDLVATVEEELRMAYVDLEEEWRRGGNRFVEMMVVDGCFLLEVIRMAAATAGRRATTEYAPNDPEKSFSTFAYHCPSIVGRSVDFRDTSLQINWTGCKLVRASPMASYYLVTKKRENI